MYFVRTNLDHCESGCGVSTQQNVKCLKPYYWCIVDHINHIHMYFVCTNTIETVMSADVQCVA